ncbi:MAG: hypothetical protein ACJARZ_000993 [Dokdonia sp.]|jgi:hypothetical protein
MKKYLILGVAMALFSCKNGSEVEVKTAPSQVEAPLKESNKDLNVTSSTSEVVFENADFGKVYAAYLEVKGSLVNTDAAAASKAVISLNNSQKELLGNEGLNTAIQEFQKSTDIQKQRALFERISAAMEVEIAKQKITSGTIYKQYCPMAFDGKGGYWLSDSKEVRNPYYGDKMLTCGVVETALK